MTFYHFAENIFTDPDRVAIHYVTKSTFHHITSHYQVTFMSFEYNFISFEWKYVLSQDPPPGSPTLHNIDSRSSLVLYEGDPLQMTCDIIGGSPLANLSWDCPGLDSQTRSGSVKRWSTVSGTVKRTLNSKTCACTAQHYAWLHPESQSRTVHTPLITVYCKLRNSK